MKYIIISYDSKMNFDNLQEWQMMLTQDDKGNYVCKVSRPDGATTSYLFFQSFKVEIIGAKLLGAAVMVCVHMVLDSVICSTYIVRLCDL